MKRNEFINRYFETDQLRGKVTKMVIAVKLPTGAIELIINTDNIENKFKYYSYAYDDNMKLNSNDKVQIIDCMFV